MTNTAEQIFEFERLVVVAGQLIAPVLVSDAEGRALWANRAFEDLSGYAVDEIIGRDPVEFLHGPQTDPQASALIAKAKSTLTPVRCELRNYHKSGYAYWTDASISPLFSKDGSHMGWIGVHADSTRVHEAQERAAAELAAREQAEFLLRDIVDSIPNCLTVFDPNKKLVFSNAMIRSTFPRFAAKTTLGMSFSDMIAAWFATEGQLPVGQAAPDQQVVDAFLDPTGDVLQSPEQRLADGTWLLSSARRSRSGHVIWVSSDITAVKQAQLHAEDLAARDPLTGLLNRTGFFGAVQLPHNGDTALRGAVLVVDVDHFKSMNDAYGHQAGDAVLEAVADRLSAVLAGYGFVARLGGDEFACFVPEQGKGDVSELVERLEKTCTQPISLNSGTLVPSVSIGVAQDKGAVIDLERLLRHADRALLEAKRLGRSRAVYYTDELSARLKNRQKMAQRLRTAIAANEITVVLQPIMRVRRQAVVGFEALARWNDDAGAVPPSEFITTAEDFGLAGALGQLVLRKALLACRHLSDVAGRALTVAVNVSNNQLLDDGFPDLVLQELANARLSPSQLDLEITETVLLERSWELLTERLDTLRQKGVKVSLDDFGTGYASLAHLGALALDTLKIDQRFVRESSDQRRGRFIARSISSLAKALALDCVAEGVETKNQFDRMVKLGCSHIQGYYVARPMDLEHALQWVLNEWRPVETDLFTKV